MWFCLANEAGVTPALKRRRERAERQRSFMREQQETAALLKGAIQPNNNEDISNIENINGEFWIILIKLNKKEKIQNENFISKCHQNFTISDKYI